MKLPRGPPRVLLLGRTAVVCPRPAGDRTCPAPPPARRNQWDGPGSPVHPDRV